MIEYIVNIYRRKDGKWETQVKLAHGKKNVIFTSAGQGYNSAKTALRIAMNCFGTGYGFQFVLDGKKVKPW